MARLGMNPSRGKSSSFRPARVTAAVLVHIPHFSGYFQHRFPVLKLCLSSLVDNTSMPMDLMIFDNASCDEVQAYLRDLHRAGIIQFLLRSQSNLGKLGAFQMIFRAAPGEVVAYCDDDFYFFPGWLEAQMQLLDTYPDVGMVSGYAIPSLFGPDRISATLEFARSESKAKLQEGKFIPQAWIRDWALSTGRDPRQAAERGGSMMEYVIEYQGLSAFASANHDQFIAPRKIIEACLPREWSGRLMGEMLELDRAVNRAGHLRLTTRERTTQHLGNVLSEELSESLSGLPREVNWLRAAGRRRAWWKRLVLLPPVRTVLLGLYSKLFRLVHPD